MKLFNFLTKVETLSVKSVIIWAILLRLIIAPFFFHPDIKVYNYQSSFLKEGVVNIYSYLSENKSHLPLKEDFVYFPLAYFFIGTYQIIATPFLGSDFPNWLSDASSQFTEKIGIFRYLLILKLPYLILDILTGLGLMTLFKNAVDKKRVLTLWLFNPFSIILIYVFSNIDIIPVFLTVVSISLALKDKLIFSAVLLGVAASFKAFPLIYLPFLILLGKSLSQKALICLAGLISFLIFILPFLNTPAFRESALLSGLTTRAFLSALNIGFNETIIIPFLFLGLLFFYAVDKLKKPLDLPKYYLAIFLIMFSFIHFHIQWLLWFIPYLVVVLVKDSKRQFLGYMVLALFLAVPFLYQDKYMNVSLFSIFGGLYHSLPTPFSVIQKIYDPYNLQSLIHTLAAAGSMILVFQVLKDETDN